MLLDTRAAGKLYPLDGVFSDSNDERGFIRDSQLSARLGYVGRTVIHPKQIAPVRRAYAVPAGQSRVLHARRERVRGGRRRPGVAAITVDGKLVDYAMYSRAKSVLELAKLDA